MALGYGFVKSKVKAIVGLKSARRQREIQYHVHLTLTVDGEDWDVAINVGTNDADDLLIYKLALDFRHPITLTLKAAAEGYTELTGISALPALDYMRSDLLSETGAWRVSDVMDGSDQAEPIPSILRMVNRVKDADLDVFLFGRRYKNEGAGIHDTHMNQGSSGHEFDHRPDDDSNDHNDVWQDGALIVDLGADGWGAYFAAFQQQGVPTDDLGNPEPGAKSIAR